MRQEDKNDAQIWGEFYGREGGIQARSKNEIIDTDMLEIRSTDMAEKKSKEFTHERGLFLSSHESALWCTTFASAYYFSYQQVAEARPPTPTYRSLDEFAKAIIEEKEFVLRMVAISIQAYDEPEIVVIKDTVTGKRLFESDAANLALDLLQKHYGIQTIDLQDQNVVEKGIMAFHDLIDRDLENVLFDAGDESYISQITEATDSVLSDRNQPAWTILNKKVEEEWERLLGLYYVEGLRSEDLMKAVKINRLEKGK